jgi:hypothetical protein
MIPRYTSGCQYCGFGVSDHTVCPHTDNPNFSATVAVGNRTRAVSTQFIAGEVPDFKLDVKSGNPQYYQAFNKRRTPRVIKK